MLPLGVTPIPRNTLRRGHPAMLPSMGGGLAAVAAVIGAGPPAILGIRTTDGGSPWYVSTAFTPRRFDVADLRVLFGEWAESERASAARVEDAGLELSPIPIYEPPRPY